MTNKVEKDGFTIKDQGRVDYAKIKQEPTNASSNPVWEKVNQEAVAALRGTRSRVY